MAEGVGEAGSFSVRSDRTDALVQECSRLRLAGEHDEAGRILARAQREIPDSPELWLAAASLYSDRKQRRDALRAAERALDLRPAWPAASMIALHAAAKLGLPDSFRTHACSLLAVEQSARPQISNKKIGGLALLAGTHDMAEDIGRALLLSDAGTRVGIFLRAAAAWEAGDEVVAERIIGEALARGGEVDLRAALAYRRWIDDIAGAGELLRALQPVHAEETVETAEAFRRQGDALNALDTVRWAREHGLADLRLDEIEARAAPLARVLDGSWPPRPVAEVLPAPVCGRVLHLVSRCVPYFTSGGTYRTQHIARAQREAGIDAVFVTSLGFPWDLGYVDAPIQTVVGEVTYLHLYDDPNVLTELDVYLSQYTRALLRVALELRPAAIHAASDFRNGLVAVEVGKALGIPVVYEVRSFPEERRRRKGGSRVLADRGVSKRELERSCLLAVDHIVTLGETMKHHIAEKGVDPGRISIFPNGVESSWLVPRGKSAELAAELGLQEGGIVLGYVSTFNPFEGIEYILEAAALLVARGYPVRVLLVGGAKRGGDDIERLRDRAVELEIDSRVAFTGRVDHSLVADYYRLIDLFVCPRRAEAISELVIPLKPFEAMATGCVVIASDTRALREIVEDGRTGRTFPADDPRHLADVCAELIDDPEQRARLAANGKAWVADERSWAGHARGYRELYESLGVF
jgi:glycosyltransferase involved in cell wall biosynthesis